MRIIELGKIRPKIVSCAYCSCLFEYLPADVKSGAVKCPSCGKRIAVN